MIEYVYSSVWVQFSVLFGLVAYVIFHQVQTDRVVTQNNLDLGFWDRLLLFRLPGWKSRVLAGNAVAEKRSRALSWQFTIITLLAFGFFQFGVVY